PPQGPCPGAPALPGHIQPLSVPLARVDLVPLPFLGALVAGVVVVQAHRVLLAVYLARQLDELFCPPHFRPALRLVADLLGPGVAAAVLEVTLVEAPGRPGVAAALQPPTLSLEAGALLRGLLLRRLP